MDPSPPRMTLKPAGPSVLSVLVFACPSPPCVLRGSRESVPFRVRNKFSHLLFQLKNLVNVKMILYFFPLRKDFGFPHLRLTQKI